jgi:hypothetical protein
MNWWKRTFGLHPVDIIVHFVAGSFLVAAFGEASNNDAIIALGIAGMFAAYAWRRQRAIAALPAVGMTSGEERLDEFHAQAEELHDLRGRVMELEERVDFAERLLARQSELEKLPEAR